MKAHKYHNFLITAMNVHDILCMMNSSSVLSVILVLGSFITAIYRPINIVHRPLNSMGVYIYCI